MMDENTGEIQSVTVKSENAVEMQIAVVNNVIIDSLERLEW